MAGKSIHIILGLFLLLLWNSCNHSDKGRYETEIDNCNEQAYRFRYKDIDSTMKYAHQAYSLSSDYADGRDEARLHLAFVAYQKMDFDGVDSILNPLYLGSHNQLLLLCADVMQMKTCQRTGDGSRFFQFKNHAESRMRRILEEQDELSRHNLALWVYAQTEFHIIASTYHFYQEQDVMAQEELAKVMPCFEQHIDTVQWIYYNYMLGPGRLVQGKDDKDVALQEFDYLFRAYDLSHRLGIRYFEANSLQAFASMFLTRDSLIAEERPEAYQLLFARYGCETKDCDLSLSFARHALQLFQQYKDLFQTACTFRTLGEIQFEREDYDAALHSYVDALHLVNVHHLRYYASISPDTLSAFNPDDVTRCIEQEWIDDSRISTVPEWIAGIRQQFSLTFSALEQKQASDYNRNIYLDLLQATNQNLELESRTKELEHQTRALYRRMFLSLVLLIAALTLFVFFRFHLKRRLKANIKELESILLYMRNRESSVSLTSKELQPYREFLQWNEAELTALADDIEDVEERLAMRMRKITENKRKNAENRAKVSLVHGIIPFLDRIMREVMRMEQCGTITPERKEYIIELIDQIELHNTILTEWIKMEQGQLDLHISTFPLEKLYRIIAEGRYSFDMKNIHLSVEPVTAYVKADESLTLFMINTLADNARKFTPAGGSVVLSAEETEMYVEIRVTDTGCGLTEKEIDVLMNNKVYDSSEIGRDKSQKGFGFGLMNCRGIIEKYRKTSALFACCQFGIRSKVGEGSTFFFRLPRATRLLLCLCFFMLSAALHAERETELYDSVYQANIDGRYDDALHYAREALLVLNDSHPSAPRLQFMDDTNALQEPAELSWAQNGVPADYELIVGLRNEIALAALALHDWKLYSYNNRVCIRLHRYIHRDNILPGYYRRLGQTHQNSNLLLVLILIFAVCIVLISYKLLVSRQMKISQNIDNMRQYGRDLLLVARQKPTELQFLSQTANYPAMEDWARQYQQLLADISVRPLCERQERLASLGDELAKQAYEDSRLYVQNQILDNCLSTVKHESMYYPSRIRRLVKEMKEEDIGQLSELVRYYRHIYTLLCAQADIQVSQPGFKRLRVDVHEVVYRAALAARRLAKRQKKTITFHETDGLPENMAVFADDILLDLLLESLLSGMIHEGASLQLTVSEEERFVRFSLADATCRLTAEEADNLFYPDVHHIPFLVAKQILREHDTYSNHPGCRLVAEQTDEGYRIYFTLLSTKV